MRVTANQLRTSAELMQELFGMNKKLISQLSEKRRYEKIYEYLVTKKGAREVAVKQSNQLHYTVLECEGEIYLIPEEFFNE